jgi:glycosyltransferase involved in cell wall biosynthesis
MVKNIKFSSVTVTYNDARHLKKCLKSLTFCEENIVLDMGSKDDCIKIAKKSGAKVFFHKRVKIPAKIRKFAASLAKNDWLIFIDPDEIFPEKALVKIKKIINSNNKAGIISLQRVNYFLGNPIIYGRWGYKSSFCPAVLNKKRIKFRNLVHRGIRVKPGYEEVRILDFKTKHYWIDSMDQFYEKHLRYLEDEGRTRHRVGNRFSYLKMFRSLVNLLIDSFVKKQGYLDKKNGLRLTMLALWYEKRAWLELKKYEEESKKV